jgi:hypothetical protein
MEEVKGGLLSSDDHFVIKVKSESGAYELARIEPMEPEEEGATAEMVLVQTCSLLHANGTFPGIQPGCMGLRNVKGQLLKRNELVRFGSEVFLCGQKGVTTNTAPPSTDEQEERPWISTSVPVSVAYSGTHREVVVSDPNDQEIIHVTACDLFNLDPSKFELKSADGHFYLQERTFIPYNPAKTESYGSGRLGTITCRFPELSLDVPMGYFAHSSLHILKQMACKYAGVDAREFETDTGESLDGLQNGQVHLIHRRKTFPVFQQPQSSPIYQSGLPPMIGPPQKDKEEAASPPSKKQRKETEAKDIPAISGHCFIILPDGKTRTRLHVSSEGVCVLTLLNGICLKECLGSAYGYAIQGREEFDRVLPGETVFMVKRQEPTRVKQV